MDFDDAPKYGCGCVVAVFGMCLITGWIVQGLMKVVPYSEDCARAADAKRIIAEHERTIAAAKTNAVAVAAQKEKDVKKEDKIRTFAMRESPAVWQAVQKLRAEKVMLEKGVARVENVLKYYGHDLASDRELSGLRKDLQEIDDLTQRLQYRLEDAYLKYVAYQATPGREDLKELCDKALVDGVQEASEVEARFNEMRAQK